MACILYAEDEETDIFFLKHAFQMAGSPHAVNTVADGEQAIDYLAGHGAFADRALYPLPAIVLLDINMPKMSGFEVLQWIRQQSRFQSLPVLILTSSSRKEDVDKALHLGAEDYLLKPSSPLKLIDIVKTIHNRWLVSRPPKPSSAVV